jgi:pimeloyl-ACP methyl ester carboxylesterase
LAWILGTAIASFALHQGIDTREVELRLSDGSTIYGVVYRDRHRAGPTPAALVLHGTAVSHSSCAPALSIPLARSGFAVLAIDLPGHGRSGGMVDRVDYFGPDRFLRGESDQPAIDAAIDFLQAQPLIDHESLVLLGYSRGGWIATAAGARRADIAGVIAICSAPTSTDALKPTNLLILAPALDLIVPQAAYLGALAQATGRRGRVGVTHGSLDVGTGRSLWLSPWSTHLSFMAEPVVAERAVQWALLSTGRIAKNAPRAGLWAADIASAIAIAGAAVAVFWLLQRCANRFLGPPEIDDPPPLAGAFAAMLLGLVVALGPVAACLGDLLPDGGFLFSSHVVAFLLTTASAACLAGLVRLAARFFQVRHRFTCKTAGIGWSTLSSVAVWLLRGTALGALTFLVEVSTCGLTLASSWLDFSITGQRVGFGAALFLVALPCCLLLAYGLQVAIGLAQPGWRGARFRAAVWLGLAFAVFLGHIWLVRWQAPLLAIPVLCIVATSFGPLPLWLLADRRGLLIGRAVNHALCIAFFLAMHLPYAGPA